MVVFDFFDLAVFGFEGTVVFVGGVGDDCGCGEVEGGEGGEHGVGWVEWFGGFEGGDIGLWAGFAFAFKDNVLRGSS